MPSSDTQRRYKHYLVLLLILLGVALYNLYVNFKFGSWRETLVVTYFPINADKRPATQAYIAGLRQNQFLPIEAFVNQQARRYGLSHTGVIRIVLENPLNTEPPMFPDNQSVFSNVFWSLKLRLWHNIQLLETGNFNTDIAIYALYHDPETSPVLSDSVGLKEGKIVVANLFADQKYVGSNHVIVTHELFHTFSALDKYNPADNYPLYPIGFAEPDKVPLFPQTKAALMGGRIPISKSQAFVPESLDQVIVTPATAVEIRWLK